MGLSALVTNLIFKYGKKGIDYASKRLNKADDVFKPQSNTAPSTYKAVSNLKTSRPGVDSAQISGRQIGTDDILFPADGKFNKGVEFTTKSAADREIFESRIKYISDVLDIDLKSDAGKLYDQLGRLGSNRAAIDFLETTIGKNATKVIISSKQELSSSGLKHMDLIKEGATRSDISKKIISSYVDKFNTHNVDDFAQDSAKLKKHMSTKWGNTKNRDAASDHEGLGSYMDKDDIIEEAIESNVVSKYGRMTGHKLDDLFKYVMDNKTKTLIGAETANLLAGTDLSPTGFVLGKARDVVADAYGDGDIRNIADNSQLSDDMFKSKSSVKETQTPDTSTDTSPALDIPSPTSTNTASKSSAFDDVDHTVTGFESWGDI